MSYDGDLPMQQSGARALDLLSEQAGERLQGIFVRDELTTEWPKRYCS